MEKRLEGGKKDDQKKGYRKERFFVMFFSMMVYGKTAPGTVLNIT